MHGGAEHGGAECAAESGRAVRSLTVSDVHVGGDVHQIVVGGIGTIPGATVRAQRDHLRDHLDELRQTLLHEPRGGHPSLFADLVVPPRREEAAAAFIILEYMGYPLFSGSNTMATAIALVEEGMVEVGEGVHDLTLESPGGLVTVTVEVEAGKATSVTYRPDDTAFVAERGRLVSLPGGRELRYDLVWAGCWYAVVDAADAGFELRPDEEAAQGELAFELMSVLSEGPNPQHPTLGDEGGVTLVLFAAAPEQASADGVVRRRISPVVHPRSVSRCPAGTGTTAAVAQLVDRGLMRAGDTLLAASSWGTTFEGRCERLAERGGVRVAVTGHGWVIARKQVLLDPSDPLTPFAALEPLLRDRDRGRARGRESRAQTG